MMRIHPIRGVKGRDIATIIEDTKRIVPQGDKISLKCLGTLDHPIAKMISDLSEKGEAVLVEISPKFFSTWIMVKCSYGLPITMLFSFLWFN